jgi:hypothetical protein
MAWENIVRDTAANFTFNNPVLLENQIGLETNLVNGVEAGTVAGKFGDGVTHWNDLGYSIGTPSRTVTDADATAAITDSGGAIYMNSADPHSVTFPAACKVKNFNCLIVALGAGTVSTVGTTNKDATVNLSGQYALATVIYSVDADKFLISGQLA